MLSVDYCLSVYTPTDSKFASIYINHEFLEEKGVQLQMVSARIRRAFRYPDDSDDDNSREELDEEGQLELSIKESHRLDSQYHRARARNQVFKAAKCKRGLGV